MIKLLLVCTTLACLVMAGSACAQEGPPASPQAKRIEAMVNKAAALVDKDGRAAFRRQRDMSCHTAIRCRAS
jgi:hypothetical protein